VEKAVIGTFVITDVNITHVAICGLKGNCPVWLQTPFPQFCSFTSTDNKLRSSLLCTGKRTLYITRDKES